MKKRGASFYIRIFIIFLLTLAGIAVFSYPYVASYLSDLHSTRLIETYNKEAGKLDPSLVASELKRAHIYNDNLAGDPVHDPFVPGSGAVRGKDYASILNIAGDGMMGYVVVPKIKVNLPIFHGTSDAVLFRGAGHIEGTSLPVGGKRTHAVIAGHTGLSSARLFTDLTSLKVGDMFFIHVLDKTFAYKINQIKIVLPENTQDLRLVPGHDYVTLLTCTPYGINSHRLLVRGTRVPYHPAEEKAAAKSTGLTYEQRLALTAGSITASVMLVLIIIVNRIQRSRAKRAQRAQATNK